MKGVGKALLFIALIAGVIAGVGYGLFFDVWTITDDEPRLSVSLAPNLAIGDVLLVSRDPGARLGWLVRCPDPQGSGGYVIGRVVGINHAKIDIEYGQLKLNNHLTSTSSSCLENPVPVWNPATGSNVDAHCVFEELGSSRHAVVTIPNAVESAFETNVLPGQAFLLSDDRTLHYDSRDFGQVDPSTCQHVVYRFYGESGWSDSAHRLTLLY